MGPPAASKLAVAQAVRLRIFPHDVGVNHDALIRNVCWLARAFICTGVLLNAFEGILCLAGDVADAPMTVAKLLLSLGHLSVSAFCMLKSKPHVFEVSALTLTACGHECLRAALILTTSAHWKANEIAFEVVERPFIALMIMCGHTILGIVGQAGSDGVLAGTCIMANASVVMKTHSDMPSLIGLPVLTSMAQLIIGLALKSITGALLKEREALKRARDGLQQNLDSQDSMWNSVFDATFLCDSIGCISRASAQAVDLFLFESAEALLGQTFSSLAAPEERERLTTFVQAVMAPASSQALTIQGAFVQSNGSRIELQVNAARVVQSIGDSSVENAFGILLGMRLIDTRREAPSAPPADEPGEPEEAVCRGGEPEAEVAWIKFDAGTEHFLVTGYSPNLSFLDRRLQLLRWFPQIVRKDLEQWVVDEVQSCGDSSHDSSEVIEDFQLRIPGVPGVSFMAQQAWLEVEPIEVTQQDEVSLPATLWLRGGAAKPLDRGDDAAPSRRPRKLRSVREESSSDGGDTSEHDEHQSVASSEDLAPSDSQSALRLKFRLRESREFD